MLRGLGAACILVLLIFVNYAGESQPSHSTPHAVRSSDEKLSSTSSSNINREYGFRYVAPNGKSSNDGLSWDTAKDSIYEALISLPGGSRNPPTAGSGTVYFAEGAKASPFVGAGVWLMGPRDPNYHSPPRGWLRSIGSALRIEGLGRGNYGPNGHRVRANLDAGGNVDGNHPGIWLSQTQSPIEFVNVAISYPGRPIVIGECSNGVRTDVCGVSAVTFENISVIPMDKPGSGPGLDITGGSFWIFLRDDSVGGNAVHAASGPRSDKAAAILIDGTGNSGNGLIQMRDMNLASGGVKFTPGNNGGSLYIENLTEEGDYNHEVPPPVWFTNYNGFVDAFLSNIQIADAGRTETPAIENDGAGPGPLVAGTIALVKGPAVVLSQYNNAFKNQRESPLLQGQSGFFNGYVVGESDIARRLGTIITARFANRATSDAKYWTTSNYAGKNWASANLADPFGGKQAGEAHSTAETQENLHLTGSCTAVEYEPHAGDWIVGGSWLRSPAGGYSGSPTDALSLTYCGNPAPNYSFTTVRGGQLLSDGQWQWQWIASKLKAGQRTTLSLAAHFSGQMPIQAYGPVLYIIPQGVASDNEVMEFASSSSSVDSACPTGAVCNVGGHPLFSSSFGTLRNCASNTNPATCGSAAAGSFIIPPNTPSVLVQTSAVTPDSQIFLIQDTSLGARLGVTCSTNAEIVIRISGRVAGASFSVSINSTSKDHPVCLSYHVIN